MELKSENFDQFDQLVNEKNNLVRDDKPRSDREKIVRAFYNQQPTMTEEEAEKLGREEITNHGFGHKAMAQKEARIFRIYSAPGNVIEIKVDSDNPEQDTLDSIELSKYLSKAIRFSGAFSSLLKSIAGELNITGRAPVLYDSPHGWCPRFAPNILLPAGTSTVSSEIPYAFSPVEMNLKQLNRLKKASEKQGGLIDGEAVDELITLLNDQVTGNVKNENGSDPTGGFEHSKGVTATKHNSSRKTTVNVWWFYEPELLPSGKTVVNATLFSEAILGTEGGKDSSNAKIIGMIPGLLDSTESWLHLMALDAEVGGVKDFDTTKGIAELSYPSDLDTEELFNSMVEGDKARSLPRVQRDEDNGNEDEILAWEPNEDSVVPSGLKEFRISGTSQNLLTPIGMLMNNSASQTDGAHSNVGRDQQLRVQAQNSNSLSSESESMRMNDVYTLLDNLLAEIVDRFINSDMSKKTVPGYQDIAWFRRKMEERNMPLKEIGAKEFGRFKFITVKVRRLSGGGQADQEGAVASFLLENIAKYPPEVRPIILQKATAEVTQDADFAESIAPTAQIILNQQKAVAENEYDTIRRRASIGKTLPVTPGDIDQDHIPVHLIDLEAHIRDHEFKPWGQLDAIAFKLGQEHVELHLRRLLSNPTSQKEAEPFIASLQELAAAGDEIIAQVQEEQAQTPEGQPMSEKEQADTALKSRDQDRKDQDLQLKAIDQQGTQEQRDSRTNIAERSQRLKEVATAEKIGRERRKDQLDEQKEQREVIASQFGGG